MNYLVDLSSLKAGDRVLLRIGKTVSSLTLVGATVRKATAKRATIELDGEASSLEQWLGKLVDLRLDPRGDWIESPQLHCLWKLVPGTPDNLLKLNP